MRAALFTESLPPLTDGVARTYTWLARAMDAEDVDFSFVSPCLPVEADPWRGRVLSQPWFSFPLYRYYRVGLAWPSRLFAALDAFTPSLIQAAAPTPLRRRLAAAGLESAKRRHWRQVHGRLLDLYRSHLEKKTAAAPLAAA